MAKPFDTRRLPTNELKVLLVTERMASNVGANDDFEPHLKYNTDNWVHAWIDNAHAVEHRSGRIVARRAITVAGQLIWMVQFNGNKFAFHSDEHSAEAAFRQATEARHSRKAIAARWSEYVKLRRKLLLGTHRIRISIDDARRAGLCELGIQGFLHHVGLGGRTTFSGRVLAVLSFFDRQVGYAVYAGYLRQQGELAVSSTAVREVEAAQCRNTVRSSAALREPVRSEERSPLFPR